jgi:chemotaxis regulatin CheY-phosphate phosphatase CheZ
MTTKPANDVLYDSEAALRLVDSALSELRGIAPGALEDVEGHDGADAAQRNAAENDPGALAALPRMLLKAYSEIISVLECLKQSRGMLERTTVERLQHTHEKLREVSSTTENAATNMLDGLDRALGLVDRLDAESGSEAAESAAALRAQLRDELFAMMSHLQFHDITTQQLNYTSSVLTDMERRLAQVAKVFDPRSLGVEVPQTGEAPSGPVAFDPGATAQNAEVRQALADEIFTGGAKCQA